MGNKMGNIVGNTIIIAGTVVLVTVLMAYLFYTIYEIFYSELMKMAMVMSKTRKFKYESMALKRLNRLYVNKKIAIHNENNNLHIIYDVIKGSKDYDATDLAMLFLKSLNGVYNYETYQFSGTIYVTDIYGNEQTEREYSYTISVDDLQRINWGNMDLELFEKFCDNRAVA